jgi:uncharacterized protein (TIGR02996 family)
VTHDDAFLQAIIEDPDDDTPRLVYADYLDERGDPRGEFIRVQLALARLPDDPRRPELEVRERRLLAEHGEEWARPLRPWVTGWTFRRGFVEAVKLPAQSYLDHAVVLRHRAPVRRFEVDLTGFNVIPAVLDRLPEPLAREELVFPLGQAGRKLVVAVRDAADGPAFSMLAFLLAQEIEAVTAPGDQITQAINRNYHEGETNYFNWLVNRRLP